MRKSRSCAQPAHGLSTPRRRLPGRPRHEQIPIMDIERINAIGNHIADLSERTTALRGYL
jgi:hypothetical protein